MRALSSLKIPLRTQQHAKFRLRGKGVTRKDERGDLIVELDVRMPTGRRCARRSIACRDALYTKTGPGGPHAMTRFTYQHLLELVDGDDELIVRLVDEGLVERQDDVVTVDVDSVLLARTLWRELEVEWPGIEIILSPPRSSRKRGAGSTSLRPPSAGATSKPRVE